jgi:hypothetical protein
LERARIFFAREMAYREAAETPDIDPDLQKEYIAKADELAQAGQVFCREASPYYAPRLTAVKVWDSFALTHAKLQRARMDARSPASGVN